MIQVSAYGTIALIRFQFLVLVLTHRNLSCNSTKKIICRVEEYKAVDQPTEALTNILFSSGTTGDSHI